MPKIKLATLNTSFVPNVEFDTEEGKINNRELPKNEQVSCKVTLATIGQKQEYLSSYSVVAGDEIRQYNTANLEKAVKKHCKNITNLDDYGIIDGKSLINSKYASQLDDLIREIAFYVLGISEDNGELDEGE